MHICCQSRASIRYPFINQPLRWHDILRDLVDHFQNRDLRSKILSNDQRWPENFKEKYINSQSSPCLLMSGTMMCNGCYYYVDYLWPSCGPDGTKPLHKPIGWLNIREYCVNWGQLHSKCSIYLSLITNLRLQPHLLNTNELTRHYGMQLYQYIS